MKAICLISFSVFAVLTIVLGLSLFDIVAVSGNLKGVLGVIDIISLGLFFKTFIRIYKYTHKD
ncbi:MAG: hypothetical protein K1W01_01610 [Muribaculaceae bacterium]